MGRTRENDGELIQDIDRILFTLLSPKEILDMSVVEVTVPEMTKSSVSNGLLDIRMGTLSRRWTCGRCESNNIMCPGHFGHIELPKPVFHLFYMKSIIRVLNCICFHCSQLLLTKEQKASLLNKAQPARFAMASEFTKNVRKCSIANGGCDRESPEFKKLKESTSYMVVFPKSYEVEEFPLTPILALKILSRLTREDCTYLGFAQSMDSKWYIHPSWMVMTRLLVPPTCIRPILMHGKTRKPDNLTKKIANICKIANDLRKLINDGAPEHVQQDLWHQLQAHISCYFDSEAHYVKVRKLKDSKKVKGLKQRLTGKEGRIRGNNSGKRVNFSSRTIIVPDPNLAADEFGCPLRVAMELSYPEVVTTHNMTLMKEFVLNSGIPNKYPAAIAVKKKVSNIPDNHPLKKLLEQKGVTEILFSLDVFADKKAERDVSENVFEVRGGEQKVADELQIGDIVERHLLDGDVVIANRQPTLHKPSMQGHRLYIYKDPNMKSFGLPLEDCAPYNADFDGDEMQFHVPQGEEAKAEAVSFIMVQNQLLAASGCRTYHSLVQDAMLGTYMMSRKDSYFEKDEVFQMLMWIDSAVLNKIPPPAILKPQPLWTGTQIISLLFPDTLNWFKKGDDDNDVITGGDVMVRKGQLCCGEITSKAMGSSAGSILQVITIDNGPNNAVNMMRDFTRISKEFLFQRSFSVGISHCVTTSEIRQKIKQKMDECEEIVGNLRRQAKAKGTKEPWTLENEINRVLSSARDTAGNLVLKNLDPNNGFKLMSTAGTKGSVLNISQISACVGQQNIEGQRIPMGFRDRTLPHRTKFDNGAASRGFIKESFISGLDPEAFWSHAMSGREGLANASGKTSETGYIYRKLVKNCEDLMERYDGTVRNASGDVIQFAYADDHFDGCKMEWQYIRLYAIKTEQELRKTYRNSACFREFGIVLKYWQTAHRIVRNDPTKTTYSIPVNIKRTIETVSQMPTPAFTPNMPVTAEQCCDAVTKLLKRLKPKPSFNFQLLVWSECASKVLMGVRDFDDRSDPRTHPPKITMVWQLEELMKLLEKKYISSLIQAGESVGVLAAQCLAEPATQMVLKVFQFSGIGSKNITLGVPRLRELIDVLKVPKSPMMNVAFKQGTNPQQLMHQLEYTTLGHLVNTAELRWHAFIDDTLPDAQMVKNFLELPDDDSNIAAWNPYYIRMVLNDELMNFKGITPEEIKECINNDFGHELRVIHSDINDNSLVMHIRVRESQLDFDYWADDDTQLKYKTPIKNNKGQTINLNKTDPKNESTLATIPMTDAHLTLQSLRSNEQQKQQKKAEDDDNSNHKVKMSWSEVRFRRPDLFMQQLMNDLLENCRIRGLREISSAHLIEGRNNTPAIIQTFGANLLGVFAIPGVDWTKTISNDVVETLRVLGVEAARNQWIREMQALLQANGIFVDPRVLSLIADTMTFNGTLMTMTRHGLGRSDKGPLVKASFEKPMDILCNAAQHTECDNLIGITSSLIVGKLGRIGTGAVKVLWDTSILDKQVYERAPPSQPLPFKNTPYTLNYDDVQGSYSPTHPEFNYSKPGYFYEPSPTSPSYEMYHRDADDMTF